MACCVLLSHCMGPELIVICRDACQWRLVADVSVLLNTPHAVDMGGMR